MDPVALQLEGHVAWIEFGDPDDRNLLTVPLLEDLPRALAEAEVRGARVVVLRGRAGIWSAGYDIAQIPAALFDPDPRTASAHPFERCMRALEACVLPTIAAVNGHAAGGAVELALACDVRLLRAGAKMGITAAKLGLVYPHAGIERLQRVVGSARAREILFTAELFGSSDALRLGLVQEVVTAAGFDARVRQVAERIGAVAPLAVQGMKRVLQVLERPGVAAADRREMQQLCARSFQSRDFDEGRAAFRQKRPPRFRGS